MSSGSGTVKNKTSYEERKRVYDLTDKLRAMVDEMKKAPAGEIKSLWPKAVRLYECIYPWLNSANTHDGFIMPRYTISAVNRFFEAMNEDGPKDRYPDFNAISKDDPLVRASDWYNADWFEKQGRSTPDPYEDVVTDPAADAPNYIVITPTPTPTPGPSKNTYSLRQKRKVSASAAPDGGSTPKKLRGHKSKPTSSEVIDGETAQAETSEPAPTSKAGPSKPPVRRGKRKRGAATASTNANARESSTIVVNDEEGEIKEEKTKKSPTKRNRRNERGGGNRRKDKVDSGIKQTTLPFSRRARLAPVPCEYANDRDGEEEEIDELADDVEDPQESRNLADEENEVAELVTVPPVDQPSANTHTNDQAGSLPTFCTIDDDLMIQEITLPPRRVGWANAKAKAKKKLGVSTNATEVIGIVYEAVLGGANDQLNPIDVDAEQKDANVFPMPDAEQDAGGVVSSVSVPGDAMNDTEELRVEEQLSSIVVDEERPDALVDDIHSSHDIIEDRPPPPAEKKSGNVVLGATTLSTPERESAAEPPTTNTQTVQVDYAKTESQVEQSSSVDAVTTSVASSSTHIAEGEAAILGGSVDSIEDKMEIDEPMVEGKESVSLNIAANAEKAVVAEDIVEEDSGQIATSSNVVQHSKMIIKQDSSDTLAQGRKEDFLHSSQGSSDYVITTQTPSYTFVSVERVVEEASAPVSSKEAKPASEQDMTVDDAHLVKSSDVVQSFSDGVQSFSHPTGSEISTLSTTEPAAHIVPESLSVTKERQTLTRTPADGGEHTDNQDGPTSNNAVTGEDSGNNNLTVSNSFVNDNSGVSATENEPPPDSSHERLSHGRDTANKPVDGSTAANSTSAAASRPSSTALATSNVLSNTVMLTPGGYPSPSSTLYFAPTGNPYLQPYPTLSMHSYRSPQSIRACDRCINEKSVCPGASAGGACARCKSHKLKCSFVVAEKKTGTEVSSSSVSKTIAAVARKRQRNVKPSEPTKQEKGGILASAPDTATLSQMAAASTMSSSREPAPRITSPAQALTTTATTASNALKSRSGLPPWVKALTQNNPYPQQYLGYQPLPAASPSNSATLVPPASITSASSITPQQYPSVAGSLPDTMSSTAVNDSEGYSSVVSQFYRSLTTLANTTGSYATSTETVSQPYSSVFAADSSTRRASEGDVSNNIPLVKTKSVSVAIGSQYFDSNQLSRSVSVPVADSSKVMDRPSPGDNTAVTNDVAAHDAAKEFVMSVLSGKRPPSVSRAASPSSTRQPSSIPRPDTKPLSDRSATPTLPAVPPLKKRRKSGSLAAKAQKLVKDQQKSYAVSPKLCSPPQPNGADQLPVPEAHLGSPMPEVVSKARPSAASIVVDNQVHDLFPAPKSQLKFPAPEVSRSSAGPHSVADRASEPADHARSSSPGRPVKRSPSLSSDPPTIQTTSSPSELPVVTMGVDDEAAVVQQPDNHLPPPSTPPTTTPAAISNAILGQLNELRADFDAYKGKSDIEGLKRKVDVMQSTLEGLCSGVSSLLEKFSTLTPGSAAPVSPSKIVREAEIQAEESLDFQRKDYLGSARVDASIQTDPRAKRTLPSFLNDFDPTGIAFDDDDDDMSSIGDLEYPI